MTMSYVDGFILPVPRRNTATYLRMARKVAKIFRAHGALGSWECMADDVKAGKWTSFPQAVKLKPGEAVWFSWILYKSRRQRDRVMARAMKDKRMASMMDPKKFPFDGKRMIFGGFKVRLRT
jgi:uncharacterized protein YbaA (DUF1428 family)